MTAITLSQIKKAIKASVDKEYIKEHFELYSHEVRGFNENKLLRYSPLTTYIAARMDLPKQKVYAALNREHKKGNLMKRSSPGTIAGWWYTGLLEELFPDG